MSHHGLGLPPVVYQLGLCRHWQYVPAIGKMAFLGCSIAVLTGFVPGTVVEGMPSSMLASL